MIGVTSYLGSAESKLRSGALPIDAIASGRQTNISCTRNRLNFGTFYSGPTFPASHVLVLLNDGSLQLALLPAVVSSSAVEGVLVCCDF